jgi:5'-nucleotidase
MTLRTTVATVLLFGSLTFTAHAQEPEPASAARNRASVTFLQINDVYTVEPTEGLGGLARVATEKKQLAAAGHSPFLVIAGDFLSPSVASSVFKGEQMIAELNATGLDVATIGNHEFDFGDDVLIQRMREARFTWVVSNVVDTKTGEPIGNAVPYLVKTFGPLKVGFIGLCLNTLEVSGDKLTHTRIIDPIVAAKKYVAVLKQQGAQVVVAVTHLSYITDRAIVEALPQIDLVIGGHEHYPITATINRSLISKAGEDARYVARIDVNRRPNGAVETFYELIPTSSAFADDPDTAAVIGNYNAKLDKALETVAGVTRVPLDGRSQQLRSSETNLGNLVADAIRADAGTDIALTNAGSIRGNRIYPAGPLTRKTLIEMHPFDNVICKLAMSGRALLDVLNNGVAKLPLAAGQFPQVSGLTMVVDTHAAVGSRVTDVRVNGEALDLTASYTVAVPDFIFKGGDGYDMLAKQQVLVGPLYGDLITTALAQYVTAQGEVSPSADGRITIR